MSGISNYNVVANIRSTLLEIGPNQILSRLWQIFGTYHPVGTIVVWSDFDRLP